MKLTTKGRYAVTAMLDLAIHDGNEPTALADIAQRQGISLSYLEQLFSRLRKHELVNSVRGPGGGYSLGHAPEDIFIADVIAAVDEKVDTTRCGGKHNCQGDLPCLTHELWHDLGQRIESYLSHISLQTLMEREAVMSIAQRQDQLAGNSPNAATQPVSRLESRIHPERFR